MLSRRIEKLTRTIRDVVSDVIQNQLSDPRIAPMTSITRVSLAADLSLAKIYISVFEPSESRQELCRQAIQSASGHIRSKLAAVLRTRTCPALEFILDESIKKSIEINRLLDQIALEQKLSGQEQSGEISSAEDPDEK